MGAAKSDNNIIFIWRQNRTTQQGVSDKIETFQMLKSGKGVEKHPEGSEHFVGSI